MAPLCRQIPDLHLPVWIALDERETFAKDRPMAAPGFFASLVRSPSFKFVLVGALVLFISALTGVVWLLSAERQSRANSVVAEVARDWGANQRILGPFMIVPYTVKAQRFADGKPVEIEVARQAVFLPDTLNVSGAVQTEKRRRAIYDVTVYQGKLALEGQFRPADLSLVEPETPSSIRWQDAFIALGIQDVSGLKNNVQLQIAGRTIDFEPSAGLDDAAGRMNGIHARLKPLAAAGLNGGAPLPYKIELALNGSSSLAFAPAGRENTVALTSNWPHPSFTGFLPVSRTISGEGFSANWSVPYLARDVPQAWAGAPQTIALDRFMSKDLGVNLFMPVDFYSLVERALKYGFLFVAAAFGGVFVLELLSGRRVHPVQYIFSGLAIVIFYVLLLSLSEHIGFSPAYLAASGATGAMISAYVGMALHSLKRGLTMLGIFGVLFGLLYMILQLEDYALLAGSIAAFVLLTTTMFATLRVNWAGDNGETRPASY
jgi:inner membrane protein